MDALKPKLPEANYSDEEDYVETQENKRLDKISSNAVFLKNQQEFVNRARHVKQKQSVPNTNFVTVGNPNMVSRSNHQSGAYTINSNNQQD